MKRLLYLVHRLPYPPDKGDKIASYHLLKFLAQRYEVHLGTFVDDPADWAHVDRVRELCTDLCALGLSPRRAKLLSLRGLLTGEALSVAYYADKRLQAWVDEKLRYRAMDAIVIFSGAMGRFVHPAAAAGVNILVDLVDVDSQKWLSYAGDKPWPLSWLYRREADKLLRYERALGARSQATSFVSREEANLFASLAPELKDKIIYRHQGVDSARFDPALDLPNPYRDQEQAVCFCGAMDYWPNVDAVVWFAREVMPLVLARQADARFYIVGRNPAAEVSKLASLPGVVVTGSVDDVRPYVRHAAVSVAPLRIARGVQNKVLEAMAMAKPVVATPEAMQGIAACPEFRPRVGRNAQELAEQICALLEQGVYMDPGARACALRHGDWNSNLRPIGQVLENGCVRISPDTQ